MKNLHMKYGTEKLLLSIEQKNIVDTINSNSSQENKSEEDVIVEALTNPIGTEKLKQLVMKGEKICIIISDITRAWQKMSTFLPYIVNELEHAGIKDEDIVFLCATGSHRNQSKEEHKILLGDELSKRFSVIDHDSYDDENMIYLGETSFGTPVRINKKAMECDHIIVTGAVVFHDLAGWGGGRKSILPGIAAYETIMANHALALSKEGINPAVRCANGIGNPIHEDMIEAAKMVSPSFLFNVIIDDKGKISSAVSGHYIKAHETAQKILDQTDAVYIKEKVDLVIASAGGYPKDINLYQASKALSNAKEAVKKGGTIILLSECIEGIGNEDMEEIIKDYTANKERENFIRKNFTVSRYIGYMIAEMATQFKIILVSEIDSKVMKKININVLTSIEEALDMVYKEKGDDVKIYIMPYAAQTLPQIKGAKGN